MKKILAINGSASSQSANRQLIDYLGGIARVDFRFTVLDDLKTLPPFDADLSAGNPPAAIIALRRSIDEADGLLICTPEYVYSIPSGLKNLVEWCIATTVLSDKPCGLITAAAGGQKAHEELQLIVKTAMAIFKPATTLLISGIRGKIDTAGSVVHAETAAALDRFYSAFRVLVNQGREE